MKYAITEYLHEKRNSIYSLCLFCQPRQHPARQKIKFQDLLEFNFSIVVSLFWLKRYHLARRFKQRWVIEKKQNNNLNCLVSKIRQKHCYSCCGVQFSCDRQYFETIRSGFSGFNLYRKKNITDNFKSTLSKQLNIYITR